MILCAGGGVALSSLLACGGRRAAICNALVFLSMVFGVMRMIALADSDGISNAGRLAVALGVEPEWAYSARRLTTYLPASERVATMNAKKILLLGEYRSAYFECVVPTVSQGILDYPVILAIARDSETPERIAVKFKQIGASHVVLNYVGSEWRGGVMAKVFRWNLEQVRRYGDFCARWLEWMPPQDRYDYPSGGFAFYKLRKCPLRCSFPIPFLPGTEGLVARREGENRLEQKRRLEELVRAVPYAGHFESTLGCVLVEIGDYAGAMAHLRRSMQCGFEDAGSYGCLGFALREMKRYREAADAFRKAALLRPEEPAFRERCKECEGKTVTSLR